MLPDEFRKDKARVKAAALLLANPVMREMLEVLRESNPVNFSLPKVGAAASDHSRQLGMIEGHCFTIALFRTLGTPFTRREQLREKYTQAP